MPKHKSSKKSTNAVNGHDINCHQCTMQYIITHEEKANLIEEMHNEDSNKWQSWCSFEYYIILSTLLELK